MPCSKKKNKRCKGRQRRGSEMKAIARTQKMKVESKEKEKEGGGKRSKTKRRITTMMTTMMTMTMKMSATKMKMLKKLVYSIEVLPKKGANFISNTLRMINLNSY
jgi:hypothetical protein